ncbi:MAG: radical SAM/SPASM domain-containing protein [Planctomycetota bacterium]
MKSIRKALNPWARDSLTASYDRVMQRDRSISTTVSTHRARIGEIEINKNCNLNCSMCNTLLSERPNLNMEVERFEQVLIKARDTGQKKRLLLHTIGEPLINPLLSDYFALLRKYGFKIFLSSNLLPLKKKVDLLCEYADVIDEFRFSIDGACKETYEKIRKPGKFSKLIESLDLFKQVNAGNRHFNKVSIDSVVSTDVAQELANHLDFYSRYVPMENIGLHLVNGLSLDNSYFLETSVLPNHVRRTEPCRQLGDATLHVLNDGRVTACCRDYNGELVFGSIYEDSVTDLINNEAIQELRRQNIDGTAPPDSLCSNCYEVDPRVSELFELFVKALVSRNKDCWDVDRMQARFGSFFQSFREGIPDRSEFVALLEQ